MTAEDMDRWRRALLARKRAKRAGRGRYRAGRFDGTYLGLRVETRPTPSEETTTHVEDREG